MKRLVGIFIACVILVSGVMQFHHHDLIDTAIAEVSHACLFHTDGCGPTNGVSSGNEDCALHIAKFCRLQNANLDFISLPVAIVEIFNVVFADCAETIATNYPYLEFKPLLPDFLGVCALRSPPGSLFI